MSTRIRHLSVGTDNIDIELRGDKIPSTLKMKNGNLYIDGCVIAGHIINEYLCVSKNEVDKLGYSFVCNISKMLNRGMAYRYVSYTKSGAKLKTSYIQVGVPKTPLKQNELNECVDFYIRCDYLLSSLGFQK